ncbi:MAG: histidine kinase [Chloroflexota bacterium]|nr:histidine kinase [Chloroflexota bacterium]
MKTERIKELEEKIDDLKKRWPAHSVSPLMFQELEDLEEELERELAQVQKGFDNDSITPSI